MSAIEFNIITKDAATHARLGCVKTPHGEFETPAFMPVGTQGSIKGLLPDQVAALGSQIILANTYHLMLRPGSELIARMGGLHRWMQWHRPILTDSGGFQVFSLADINRIDDHGVRFRSHIDGRMIDLDPERAMQVQNELGSDIIMAFDDCPPAMMKEVATSATESPMESGTEGGEDIQPAGTYDRDFQAARTRHAVSPEEYDTRIRQANERTVRWLERCIQSHHRKSDQALFGIIQGGTDLVQRSWCAERITAFDLPGYAIGGVAVGEPFAQLKAVIEHTSGLLPLDRPRYLMGVGYERDILTAVQAGVDMFDCVLPTRNGRNGNAFTAGGQIRLRNAQYRDDPGPIDSRCDCPVCKACYSRSYLRHLFLAGEMLGPILLSIHNIRHFQRYLLDIRAAIAHNDWSFISRRWPVVASEATGEAVT